eukprot:16470-Heterococcus_DN1.PRE.1
MHASSDSLPCCLHISSQQLLFSVCVSVLSIRSTTVRATLRNGRDARVTQLLHAAGVADSMMLQMQHAACSSISDAYSCIAS